MKQRSEGLDAAGRARWLAELAATLGEAQGLLQRIGISTSDSPIALELYLRIEETRFSVEALRLRGADRHSMQPDPKWSESSPWRVRV